MLRIVPNFQFLKLWALNLFSSYQAVDLSDQAAVPAAMPNVSELEVSRQMVEMIESEAARYLAAK